MTVTVRWLQPDEWHVLRDLRLRALADAPDAFGGPGIDAEAAQPDEAWRKRFDTADWLVISAANPARPGSTLDVGLLCLAPQHGDETGAGWIFSWWVDAQARGGAVTSAMVRAVDERCRERGWTSMGLGTFPENDRARRAFARLGFVAGPQQRGTMPPYPDYIPMTRAVPAA